MIIAVAERFAAKDGNTKFETVEEEEISEEVAKFSSISFSENVQAFLAAISCLS